MDPPGRRAGGRGVFRSHRVPPTLPSMTSSTRSLHLSVGLLLIGISLPGCTDGASTPPPAPAVHGAYIGNELPGLTPEETERFIRGGALFRRIFSPEEGLGPLFNENSCNACHTDPADGGTGDQFMIRATATRSDGGCDLLGGEGANVRQQATPLLQAHGIFFEEVPAAATAVGRFNVPFIFGLGLVEAIPEETILARVGDPGPHGELSGRAGRDPDGRFARFGRKADVATLFDFVEEAAHLEMGLTTPVHPDERGPNLRPLPEGTDPAPNPELDLESLELLTDFVRFLAPIGRRRVDEPGTRALVERGAELFRDIGCAGCHVPFMDTGPHPVEALAHKRIHLYSDLLLHDMGPELADVCSPAASNSELRTEMLMGLSEREVYLHDSRAGTLWEAIGFHGGEAAGARERFQALDRVAQEALIQYLRTL
jgi:CxxC motif-containing protein (DUF1111 family)